MEGFGGEAFIGFTRSPSPPGPTAHAVGGPGGPSIVPSARPVVADGSTDAGPSTSRHAASAPQGRSHGSADNRHSSGSGAGAGAGPGFGSGRPDAAGSSIQGQGKKRKRGTAGDAGSSAGGAGHGNGSGGSGPRNATTNNGSNGTGSRSNNGYAKKGDRKTTTLQQERDAEERNCPWATQVDWEACTNPAQMLNAEISAYYRFVSPTTAEFEVRLLTIEQISRVIKREWPKARVEPFGSWQTQLYLPHGDIDLVVTNDTYPLGSSKIPYFLRNMAQSLRKANVADNIVVIAKARVPIIKFVTTDGRIQVDMSVNQTNGLSAANIVSTYLDAYPGSRQLIMVVKALLSQRHLNEVFNGGLGSYSIICIVISFLQMHPKIHRDHINPEQNLGVLLMEFFELYGRNFYYDVDGISLLRGGSYYRKSRKGFYNSQRPFLLSIEDPQQPDNDISVGSFNIPKVKQAFSGAHDMLQVRLFERVNDIAARRSGRSTAEWQPGEMSILNAIMGATHDLLRSRARLLEVYTSGRLRTKLSIDHDPRTDLSLHVSNFRRPHVVAPWSAAGVAAAQNALASSSSAGPSRPNGPGSDSASHILFDDDDDAEVVLQRAARHGHAGGPSGLAAVMMDDHDMSRGRGEYSSDDDDDEGESRARAVPAAKAKAKAKAKAEAIVKARVQAKAKAGVQEISDSDSDSDSSTGSSDDGSSDSDSDVQWISGGGNSSGAQSALQARRSKSRSKIANDGKGKAGSQSKSKSRTKSRSTEQRMAERFESVSHDEDDYEVHAERLLREKEEQEAGGGGSGSGSANMDMDEQDELDSSDEDAGVRKEDADADDADEADSRYSTSNRQASKRRKFDKPAEPSGRPGNGKVTSASESDSDIAFVGTANVAGSSGSNSAGAPASDSTRLQVPASSTSRSNDNGGQDSSAGLSIKGRARSVASADPTDSRVLQSANLDPASASGSGVVSNERQGDSSTTARAKDLNESIAPAPAPQAPDQPGQADTAASATASASASVPAERNKSHASRQARRDYWAGKASKPGDGDQDKDEFAEGESYISLTADS